MKPSHFLIPGAMGAVMLFASAGCDPASSRSGIDPFAQAACRSKLEEIAGKLQAFEASKKPAAKRSALDSPATDSTKRIQVFRGYPPVVTWTPPEGFDTSLNASGSASGTSLNPSGSATSTSFVPPTAGPDTSVRDTAHSTTLPASFSAIQIVSDEAYKAHIAIYDEQERLIRAFDQEFGYRGGIVDTQHAAHGRRVSYLAWDNRDSAGVTVPDGVYLWKIRFAFESGALEDTTQLTGFLGESCQAALAPPP